MPLIKGFFLLGPLIFGLAFIAPLTAQIFAALAYSPPLGIEPLVAGFILGGTWGTLATLRGRWL